MWRYLLPTLALIPTPGTATEPTGWDLLSAIEIEETGGATDWRVEKAFPDALVAAAEDFTVDGYLVHIAAEPYLQTFMVVPDPADCPFCGNGGYGPTLEVVLAQPYGDLPEAAAISVTGRLTFLDDPDTWQAVRLVDAHVTPREIE